MYKRIIAGKTFKTRSEISAEITGYAVYKTVFVINGEKFVYFGKQAFNVNPDMTYIGSGRLVREKLAAMKDTDTLYKIVVDVFKTNEESLECEHDAILDARKQGLSLLNISSGNAGGRVFDSMTPEQIKARNEKISETMKGHTLSDETKKKIALTKIGKKRSASACQAISKAKKGVKTGPKSAEQIANMKLAQQARRLREAA
ncbi:TPA: hypothetical protein L0X66_001788 [Citrobacter freundii]|nr:hypothetical protein [Citrobacter freundii]